MAEKGLQPSSAKPTFWQQTKRSHLSAHTTHSLSAHEALTQHQATRARSGAVNENQGDKVLALTELTCAVSSPDPLFPSLGAPPGTGSDLTPSAKLGQQVVSRAQRALTSVVK